MLRKLLILVLLLSVGFALAKPAPKAKNLAADPSILGIDKNPTRLIHPDDPVPPWKGQAADRKIGRDDAYEVSVGTGETIGETWYDYQHNGTISKMIALDDVGNIHVIWMKGYDAASNERHMNYNVFKTADGAWAAPANNTIVVDAANKAGYGHVGLIPVDEDGSGYRAVAFFHSIVNAGDVHPLSTMSVDFLAGLGAFGEGVNYMSVWPGIAEELIWPKGAISLNLHSHMLGNENGGEAQDWQRVAYWYGEPADNDYLQWNCSDVPIEMGTAGTISTEVSASSLSNKVVLCWLENRIGRNTEAWANGMGVWQHNNDIRYVVLDDGQEFDPEVDEIKSLTKIIPPNPDMWIPEPVSKFDPFDPDDPDEAYGDIWRPYCDVDIQFDPWDDNLYAAFATNAMWERPNPNANGNLWDGMTGEHDLIWFWNSELDTITLLANGWYYNRMSDKTRCGAWRMNADRPSIAFDPNHPGRIYVTWVSFPQIQEYSGDNNNPWIYLDGASDTSKAGFDNAEIMVSVSTDYGITWREPIDITGTRWLEDVPPEPGQCKSEAYQSVATIADGYLHLMYVADGDAGGLPQNEGVATNSPVVYQKVPLENIPIDTLKPLPLPYDGFIFHNYPQARPEVVGIPTRFPAAPTPVDQVTITGKFYSGGAGMTVDSAWIAVYPVDEQGDSTLQDQLEGQRFPMEKGEVVGDTTTFTAVIDAVAEGKSVWYRLTAKNSGGLSVTYPQGEFTFLSYTVRAEGSLTIRDIQYHSKNWNVDYSPYRGLEVTVSGIVTTPATYNDKFSAYAIQDGTDMFAGVLVRGIADQLNTGDQISVTGTVMERDPNDEVKWEFATYIDVTSYNLLSEGNELPDTVDLSANQLLYNGGAENWEAMFVRLYDLTIPDTSGHSADYDLGYWPITDNNMEVGKMAWMHDLGMSDEDIATLGWKDWAVGTRLDHVIGIMTENYGHYAVGPRFVSDVGVVSVNDKKNTIPTAFKLNPVYPNPFNGMTRVSFDLPDNGQVKVTLYDLSGRAVMQLADAQMDAGSHSLNINASSLATGVYMLRVQTATANANQKIVLLK